MSAFNTFMRRTTIGAAATIAALALPATAMAADAYGSFTGVNGAGGFTYGSTNGTAFTPFVSSGPCVITGTTCLQRSTLSAGNDYLPGAYQNSGGAFTFGTVNVPATSLVLHPGPENLNSSTNLTSVYAAFTAVTAGVYNYSAIFRAVDSNPSGVGLSSFTLVGGTPTLASLGSLGTSFGSNLSTSGSVTLAVGDSFGFIIDKGFNYYNDSTSLAFSISAAPEPGTWAMMIVGFGFAGVALRRRKTMTAATA